MTNKSGASNQVITLPSGGGALSGIGEKFAPDLFTGTGNFTVPIALPSGRNGFQPELNLVYSTGNGNSCFGLGWDLSIPGVTRKSSQGIPRYRDNEQNPAEPDVFILSGAEDLVPLAVGTDVRHYRPRTEGLFAQIERHTENSLDYWRVRSKDGLVSFYGDTPAQPLGDPAIVADPDLRQKIFSWMLVRTEDPFGNHILYDYVRDSDVDALRDPDLPPPDPNDLASHHWDQLYLERIRYIDYDNGGPVGYLASVEFVYEDRTDAFSSYRAGFEMRTRRRCNRIVVRTHAGQDRIVRRYHLDYLDQRFDLPDLPERLPANRVSLLSRVRVEGIDEAQPFDAQIEPLPPLEFDYSRFEPEKRTFQPFTAALNALPDRSLNDPAYELTDLFGNGLPDVIQMNGTARYWRNLGGGQFDLPRPMDTVPAGATLQDTGVQLADLNGDGRTDMMVTTGIGPNGYYATDLSGAWQKFTPYQQSPSINLEAPDVRLVDLDGDGITDALRTGTSFELFYHDRKEGWTTLELVARGPLEEFPNINFSDPRVKLGDMSGDDLQDIVLVHNGRVDYWPYMGYGRWGKRITMSNSPVFPDAVLFPSFGFDPARVLIGDVDGDGLEDLIYVQADRITVWINQNGNGWSDPITVKGTPPITNLDAVRVVDMLGVGTAGILWSYDLTTQIDSTYKFLDLTGAIKPYVLNKMDNHMGAVTRVRYASSTEFYRADAEQPETRWQTPLPFPVQVVSQVQVEDHFSNNTVTTEYRYRHGYWDGVEREFRGFGMVEQVDTERFAQPAAPDDVRFTPPMLTRTWFHQGAITLDEGGWEEADYSAEYWPGDLLVLQRPAGFILFLQDPTVANRTKRDAVRSLRGRILRTELYALDGGPRQDRPYTVTESQFNVDERHVAQNSGPRRIFFPTTVAMRTTQWERGNEPMTSFSFTGDFDDYGQPRRQIALAVPRGRDYTVAAAAAEPYLGTVTTTRFAQPDDQNRYIVDRVASATAQEIINDGTQPLFDLVADVENGALKLALFAQSFTYYDGPAFVGLPLGDLGDFGAPVRMETLVLTEEILQDAYKSGDSLAAPPEIPPYLVPGTATNWPPEYPTEFQTIPTLAGYTFADDTDHREKGYFVQSTRSEYDFQKPMVTSRRGLMKTLRDPLNNDTTIDKYDGFDLMPLEVTNAVGLTTTAAYDYRVMQPRQVTDPNGNVSDFTFTPLGLLHETFLRGKQADEGDQGRPSTRLRYDWLAFVNSPPDNRQPIYVHTIQFEHHDTEPDVPLPERDDTIEMREFSDGFGRLLQTRTQAEDRLFGDAIFGNDVCPASQDATQATLALVVGDDRNSTDPLNVVVSGWQFYDNKGQEVIKFEPFYSTGFVYLHPDDEPNDVYGQRVTMVYDPRGQVIRTIDPDGSQQRVIYGRPQNPNQLSLTADDLTLTDVPVTFVPTPWEAYTYDANDLAPISEGPLPNGTQGLLTERAPAHHHFTPSHIVIDALGRTVLAVARNRTDSNSPIEEFRTQSTYDIRGNLLTVTDAEGREAFTYTYDLANRPLRTENIDAGVRRVILDAVGNEIERRDRKGSLILQAYDDLHRPLRLWARDDAGSPTVPTLSQRLIYGDSADSGLTSTQSKARNLDGSLYKHYDEAGLCIFDSYDFKGNLLAKVRRVIADDVIMTVFPAATDPNPNWTILPFRVDWQPPSRGDLSDRETTLLEVGDYQTFMTYDALNRVKTMRYPQDVGGGPPKILRPRYNRAGALEGVALEGDTYVEHIAYNARGQRTLLALGNNVMTRYAYDLRTFRLARMRSERYIKPDTKTYQPGGSVLQDFAYEYDLVGNILHIRDRAPGSGVLPQPDRLDRTFGYDATYRLIRATGREHAKPIDALPWDERPRSQDVTIAQPYTEEYEYDRVGNMNRLQHAANVVGNPGGFTRRFFLQPNSNQLDRVIIGNNPHSPFVYGYDANGNMVREHTARHFEWDHSDQMKAFRNQVNDAEPSIHAHYLYDAAGMRVKKLVRRQNGGVDTTIYIDGIFEHHRWQRPSGSGENNHLHIMDDQKRIALVRVGLAHPDDEGPLIQYHLGDHLGSSNVIVGGEQASNDNFVNREQHTPYGEASFGSFGRKRYRFTGKERDEESGLNYHGARYFASWVVRWLCIDPIYKQEDAAKNKLSALLNMFVYASNNPLLFIDPDGKDVYILIDHSGRDIDKAAVNTRKEYLENHPDFDPQRDYVYPLHEYNLGKLEERISRIVDDAEKNDYGKTVEVSFFGHSGIDGPIGAAKTSGKHVLRTGQSVYIRGERWTYYKTEPKQLSLTGWKRIDFNWERSNSKAFFWGCNALAFAKKFISIQDPLEFAGGYDVSSYPSLKVGIPSFENIDEKAREGKRIYYLGETKFSRLFTKVRPHPNHVTWLKVVSKQGKERKVEVRDIYSH